MQFFKVRRFLDFSKAINFFFFGGGGGIFTDRNDRLFPTPSYTSTSELIPDPFIHLKPKNGLPSGRSLRRIGHRTVKRLIKHPCVGVAVAY